VAVKNPKPRKKMIIFYNYTRFFKIHYLQKTYIF
jgi:hypothetical protein